MSSKSEFSISSKQKRIMVRWVKIILVVYVVIGLLIYSFQEKMLLHPEPLKADYVFKVPFKEVNIPVSRSENFNIVQFFPGDSIRKGVVLYFHGNMKNIYHYAKAADIFTKHGYEVWMPDYPGFGKTTGKLTEKKLYNEALVAYRLANRKFSADSIIIYGRSFGTGIASQLATWVTCRRLILETPYYSIPALFRHYAPIYPTFLVSKFNMPVNEYLKDVSAPVTIFHGTDDRLIPYSLAKKLTASLKPADEFITIEKGKHNNLSDFALYRHKLDSLIGR